MPDFRLNEEQLALVESAEKFALGEIKPVAPELDRADNPWPDGAEDIARKGLDLGFGSILIDQAHGGYGGSLIDYMLVIEKLAYGDAGLSDVFVVNNSLSILIQQFAREPLRSQWLSELCPGDTGHRVKLLAGGVTEPTGGSEVLCPLPDPGMGVRTSASREDDHYVINGNKCYITSGSVADLYLVLVRTDKTVSNMEGCSTFIIPADTPGLSFGKKEDKVGHRLSVNAELVFQDLCIPAEYMLGEEGSGIQVLTAIYGANGLATSAAAVGLAQAAYDEALAYSRERKIWGQAIANYGTMAANLVDMRMKIETMRAITWRMASALDNSEEIGQLAALAKLYTSTAVREVTLSALDVFGGYGYSREFPMEKYHRDSLMFAIADGANDVLKTMTAQQL